jgi:hypothetical protein
MRIFQNRISKATYKFLRNTILVSGIICWIRIGECQIQQNNLIQLSGLVITENKIGEPTPLPYVEISIQKSHRGTYSDENGFFSLAVQKGDTLVFNYLGYKPGFYSVPDSLNDHRYTIFQIMTRDPVILPQTVVYPWPSKEHFKQEFLNMDINDKLKEIAKANLAQETIKKLLTITPPDGRETASLYLKEKATKEYYRGQFQPMNILSPSAWIDFFKAWKRGDFRRK